MKEIIEEWVDNLLSNYPIRVVEVDEYIRECAGKIVKAILDRYNGRDLNTDEFENAVDDLMRYIASGQESPREAMQKLLALKEIFIKREFDFAKIDKIFNEFLCVAFEYYVLCKSHIYELRIKEIKNENEMLRKIMEYAEKYYRDKER
uniref:Uncharacterized protein n=1 Tax=Geoglobus ahangari TaxID=113653 RepID=A0A7C4S6G5_9EURY